MNLGNVNGIVQAPRFVRKPKTVVPEPATEPAEVKADQPVLVTA